jgi:hypothetical protein
MQHQIIGGDPDTLIGNIRAGPDHLHYVALTIPLKSGGA